MEYKNFQPTKSSFPYDKIVGKISNEERKKNDDEVGEIMIIHGHYSPVFDDMLEPTENHEMRAHRFMLL